MTCEHCEGAGWQMFMLERRPAVRTLLHLRGRVHDPADDGRAAVSAVAAECRAVSPAEQMDTAMTRAEAERRVIEAAHKVIGRSGSARASLNAAIVELDALQALSNALAALNDALPADSGWRPIERAAIAWYEAGNKLTKAAGAAKLEANGAFSLAGVALRKTIKDALPSPPDSGGRG